MALTEDEKLICAEILGVTYIDVNDKITNLGSSYITATVEARIQAKLAEYATASTNFTNIHPNLKNFGAEIKYKDQIAAIRNSLASLLYFTDLMQSGGITSRLMRG